MDIPAKYRHRLPHEAGRLFLTDGGIETCLTFQDGSSFLTLPPFT